METIYPAFSHHNARFNPIRLRNDVFCKDKWLKKKIPLIVCVGKVGKETGGLWKLKSLGCRNIFFNTLIEKEIILLQGKGSFIYSLQNVILIFQYC